MALLVSTTAISVPSTFCSLHNDILCVREKAFLRSSQNCQQLVRHSMMRKALQVNTRRQMTSTLASATNGWEEPVSSSEYLPTAEFYKVEAIIRPWRVSHVATSLVNAGIRGVTVTDVRGFGSQGGSRERHAGSEFSEDSFVAKIKLEVVVTKDQVEVVVEAVIDQARTGEIGDGKIFISPVADVVRVRTGERGFVAERMKGGRAERHSANAC